MTNCNFVEERIEGSAPDMRQIDWSRIGNLGDTIVIDSNARKIAYGVLGIQRF